MILPLSASTKLVASRLSTVAVGAFAIRSKNPGGASNALKHFRGVKDSKQLTEKQREEWFDAIKKIIKELASEKSVRMIKKSDNGRFTKDDKDKKVARGEITKKEMAENSYSISFAVSFSSEKTIDRKGINRAVYLALNRCLKKLEKKGFASVNSKILMDGLLKAQPKYKYQKTIIGGDESEPMIALASISPKFWRSQDVPSGEKISRIRI